MLSGKSSIGRRRRKSRYYINESIYQQTPAWYVGASFSFHPECPVVWPCGDIDNSSLALTYHKDGMSYRLSACRGYFNRFSQVIIQFFGIPKWFAIKIHTWHLICFYYRHYHEKYDRLWSLFFARLTHHGILLERSRAISEQMGEKGRSFRTQITPSGLWKAGRKAVLWWSSVQHRIYFETLRYGRYSLYGRLCDWPGRESPGNPIW